MGNSTNAQSCCTPLDLLRYSSGLIGDPRCFVEEESLACEAGFFAANISSTAQDMLASCPAGAFCPRGLLCLLPCTDGSYCPPRTTKPTPVIPSPTARSCDYLGACCDDGGIPLRILSLNATLPLDFNSSFPFICPGASINSPCTAGYYCPTPTQRFICPSGHFCRAGSVDPYACNALTYCPTGSIAPRNNFAPALLLLGLLAAVAIIFFLATKQARSRIMVILSSLKKLIASSHSETYLMARRRENESLLGAKSTATYNGDGAASVRPVATPVSLSFRELELTVGRTRILGGVSGDIAAGTLTAVMGPSGCGKTSFLSVLSGKVSQGSVRGTILINGENVPIRTRAVTGFVPQEDTMHRSLTVEEVLSYQISLRCPANWDDRARHQQLERTIRTLELGSIRASRIGDEETRGISGGQRKRVNIGMELVADPALLFLDEPTSGLDSSSSLDVVRALRALARAGMTIVVVLHQPRYEIFEDFDQVLFLGKSYALDGGGRTVFFDATKRALEYFTNLGYTMAEHANPADFIIDVIGHAQKLSERAEKQRKQAEQAAQAGFDPGDVGPAEQDDGDCPVDYSTQGRLAGGPLSTEQLFAAWEQRRAPSVPSIVRDTSLGSGAPIDLLQRGGLLGTVRTFLWVSVVFLLRSFTLTQRIAGTLALDAVLVIFGAFFLGAIYSNVALEEIPGMETLSSLVIGLTTMLASLRVFGTDRAVFWREASAGINRVSYFLATSLAHLPVVAALSIMYVCVLHTLLTPRMRFVDHWAVIFLVAWAASGIAYFFSCAMHPRNTQMAAVVFVLISSMLSGSSPSLTTLQDIGFLGRALAAVSFSRWMVEALFNRECATYPEVFAPKVQALTLALGYDIDDSHFAVCGLVLLGFGFIGRLGGLLSLLFLNRDKQR